MKKKRKALPILVITLCVLVGAYAAIMVFGNKGTDTEEPKQEEMVIYTCSPSRTSPTPIRTISALHLERRGLPVVLRRRPDLPLKQSKLTAMVRTLKSFSVLRLVQQGTDNLVDFGLDKPLYSFTAVTGDGRRFRSRSAHRTPRPRTITCIWTARTPSTLWTRATPDTS
jgi:hypothetical protein